MLLFISRLVHQLLLYTDVLDCLPVVPVAWDSANTSVCPKAPNTGFYPTAEEQKPSALSEGQRNVQLC